MERKLLDMTNQLFISEYNPRMEYCDKFLFVYVILNGQNFLDSIEDYCITKVNYDKFH